MKISGRSSQIPALLHSSSPPDSDIQEEMRRSDRRPNRRKIRSHGRRTSRPSTPRVSTVPVECSRKDRRKAASVTGEVAVSARKMAAGLWQLQQGGGDGGGGENREFDWKFESGDGHMGAQFHRHVARREFGRETKDLRKSPLSQNDGFRYKVDRCLSVHMFELERATKWNPVCLKASDDILPLYGNSKLIEDSITTASSVSVIQAELEQARTRIQELETERRASNKKLEHFLTKVSEEKAAWRRREHEKIQAIIDDFKDDLSKERKNRRRMEIVNSKLVDELADAKSSAKRFMQNYEKEREARKLREKVCDKLAQELGEERAENETLKREAVEIREELEGEKKMLQTAEVWREERVQMKLVDAKLTLEEKYSQLSKLIMDLESFLRSRSETPGEEEIREAEFLLEAASLVRIQDIKEFTYEPPNPEETIYSYFGNLQLSEANEREIDPVLCLGYSPESRASKIQTFSPELDKFSRNSIQKYSEEFNDHNGDIEDDESGWETVSHTEDQRSSYSPEGRDSNAGRYTSNSEISEICSVNSRQSKKKGSAISRIWRSCPSNGDSCKIVSVDGVKGRLSNGRLSNGGIYSPDHESPPDLMNQWSSPDSLNPHINRGMKGCIEWPRGTHQKHSLKSKLMEARIESQRIQLRHVLKQKI
ncbi:hypothetical protein GIB67_011471 [Kingdonia uniflora]|uniref:Uncharacterized protein n=1 Tax=Kingdonia uniflora TaxID=39325 RepID=A0A7J7NLS7_9MAGN|nr:hypothetical protein GIB67_011471 [Kingdonia uniflora]